MTRKAQGFTLLEVMMAMAILAICLSAVFSTEAGAIRMATRARKTSVAALLVRCKMGEIEEKIAKEGMPAVYAQGQDSCCEDAPLDGFSCKWDINPILMPDTMFGDPSKNPLANGSLLGKAGQAAGASPTAVPGQTPGAPGALPAGAAVGAAALGATGATPPPESSPIDALTTDPTQMLRGGGPVDGLASMAMQFVYPSLKASFEAQIKRVTVTVMWKEGSRDHSFDVTQYLVAEQPPNPVDPNSLPPGQSGPTGASQPGSTGATSAPAQPASPFGGLLGGSR